MKTSGLSHHFGDTKCRRIVVRGAVGASNCGVRETLTIVVEPVPGAGQAPQPQQAPFGSSPATGPTPNKGYEAAALQRLGLVVKQLQEMVPLAGVGTDVGKGVLDALRILSKLVPPGSVTPASEKNQLESQMMKNAQGNQQMMALRAQMAGGQGGGQPGQQPQPPVPRAA